MSGSPRPSAARPRAAARRVLAPFVVAVIAFSALAGCGGDSVAPITELPRDLTLAELRIIDGSNTFAFDLLRELVLASDSPNVFISPLSASMALGMTMNGAEGETWSEMRGALGFAGMDEAQINQAYRDLIALLLGLDSSVRFGIANSVWAHRTVSLLPAYTERLRSFFGADARTVDFKDPRTGDLINRWVSDATNGRIPRMIEQIPPDVVMYLINAVHFKGDWRSQFRRSRTGPAPFHRDDGSTRQVDMMGGEVGYRTLGGWGSTQPVGVELPYARGAFSAVAILPPQGQPIREFVAGLDAVDWADWMSTFDEQARTEDTRREGMLVRLPRFQVEWQDSLISSLRALGMVQAFDANRADFSRMTGGRDLYISEVFQKTFLRVDEEGTEAAAATSVGMGPTSAPPSLVFDRPFLFAIRERFSGTILFIGVIGDPRPAR
jgi:serine protease inhibitor